MDCRCAGLAALFAACVPLRPAVAQQNTPNQAPPTLQQQAARAEAGLESPWDVQAFVNGIGENIQRLRPILAQINPQQWYDQKGAPSAYILQAQEAQRQLSEAITSGSAFANKPESLSTGLDEYFRLEALDVTLRSLEEGARAYAPRGIADGLDERLAQNFNSRERLRDYLKELANSTEQNFKIADQEAQRCRAMISNVPPATTAKRSKH
jgi:hypothetical protein